MRLRAGVPERKLTFVAYKGFKTDKTGHVAHAKHSWSYTILLITFVWRDAQAQERHFLLSLTLWLLMSYIYGAPSKARNANVVYIWAYVWQR